MKTLYEKVAHNPLFFGINEEDFVSMLPCVQGQLRSFHKGEAILLAGDAVENLGLLVSGRAQILREDAAGRQSLLDELQAGDLYGEVFACLGSTSSPVTVLAMAPCEVLQMQYRKVIALCKNTCLLHHRLIENMLTLIAQKNLALNNKIELISKRSTRERLLLYLEQEAKGAREFCIPLKREELASYLCVERSAMSAELSRMQREGLIHYHKNQFKLL